MDFNTKPRSLQEHCDPIRREARQRAARWSELADTLRTRRNLESEGRERREAACLRKDRLHKIQELRLKETELWKQNRPDLFSE